MQSYKQYLVLVLVGSCLIAPRSARAEGKVWALLVGVSKYQNPQISTLRFPAADAAGIRDALVDPELGGVPAANIRLLTDEQATASNIISAVDGFLKPNVQPGDQVILFLAGHGVVKGVGLDAKSFLLPNDVKGLTTASLEESAVNLRKLSEKLGQLPASQFLVFVDACREDPTPGRGVKGNILSDVLSRGVAITPQNTGRPASSASFFACSIGQRAFEDPALSHGVFTYWILEGVRTAATARRPDGAVDMGILSSYVKNKVASWAKQASAKGDFEVEQTPEFVSSELTDPMILMRVKKALPETSLVANASQVTVLSDPPGALVSLDGERIGAAPLTRPLPKAGRHTLRIEAPGYAPLERQLTALEGYDLLLTVSPPPGVRGGGEANSPGQELYARAQEAELRQQWEVAEAGYDAALKADNTFIPAYERLASLRKRLGKLRPALETLIQMVSKTAPTAHSYSLLSAAYTELARQEATPIAAPSEESSSSKGGGLTGALGGKVGGLFGGKKKKEEKKEEKPDSETLAAPATYIVPKDAREAALLAYRAAQEAVKREASSSEANAALGFALLATDREGKNKDEALAAFGKAILFQPKDASNHYAMGFGIRFFAVFIKEESSRKAEIERAVSSLKEALSLRSEYYEAHRELAYCYHLLEKTTEAQRQYEQANANRGAASSSDEVAALNLSLSGLYRQQAKNATGDKKAFLLAASDGYLGDAKDITPSLEAALRILTKAQVSTRLTDYLPNELQKKMNELRDKLRLPGFKL